MRLGGGGDRPELTPKAGQASLRDHIADKAAEARAAHGPDFDPVTLAAFLDDRRFVRYPVRIAYDASRLQPGEFAHTEPIDDTPANGFVLWMHPSFEGDAERLPLLVAYHLVTVNYGDIATHEEAELFGSTLLGLEVEDYYERLCAAADSIA